MGAGGDAAFAQGGDAGGEETVTARVLLDAMGNFSPIMRQARGYKKPDGVCLVVGTCARGDWIDNSFGDLIYSFTPIMGEKQYFWEAFPSTDKHGSGSSSPLDSLR
jgi:lycopene cyclase CruP